MSLFSHSFFGHHPDRKADDGSERERVQEPASHSTVPPSDSPSPDTSSAPDAVEIPGRIPGSQWTAFTIPQDVDRHIMSDLPHRDSFPFDQAGWCDMDLFASSSAQGGEDPADDLGLTSGFAPAILGFFPDSDHIVPMAFCDSEGNIFTAHDWDSALGQSFLYDQGAEKQFADGDSDGSGNGLITGKPLLSFVRQSRQPIQRVRLEGPQPPSSGGDDDTLMCQRGVVIITDPRSQEGQWASNWLEFDGYFTLEQTVADLPDHLKFQLPYKDIMAIAYFELALYPLSQGINPLYGLGDVSYRLSRQAPLSAMRSIKADVEKLDQAHLTVSGVQEYALTLFADAGAFEQIPGLEAEHGKEPEELVSNKDTQLFIMVWDGLDLIPAMNAIRLESAVNRIRLVSDVIEISDNHGNRATEEYLTAPQVAALDAALLKNPAFNALSTFPVEEYTDSEDSDYAEDSQADADVQGFTSVNAADQDDSHGTDDSDDKEPYSHLYLMSDPDDLAQTVEEVNSVEDLFRLAQGAARKCQSEDGTEWSYRQTLARLISYLRMPFRYDATFRANRQEGKAAIAFTVASSWTMPLTYADPHHEEKDSSPWKKYSEAERDAMSTDYNLRLGIILAALAFGAGDDIKEVSIRLDTLGLEEQARQRAQMAQGVVEKLLASFENMRKRLRSMHGQDSFPLSLLDTTDSDESEKKSDPKDGDLHGSQAGMAIPGQGQQGDMNEPLGQSQEEINSTFAQMMKDVDLDAMEKQALAENRKDQSAKQAAEAINREPDSSSDTRSSEQNSNSPVTGSQEDSSGGKPDDSDDQEGFTISFRPETRTAISADSSEDSGLPLIPLTTVTFTRDDFLPLLKELGLQDPRRFYQHFDAAMEPDDQGKLQEIPPTVNIHDDQFSPHGAHDEPEMVERQFDSPMAEALATPDSLGMSIQREDILQWAQEQISKITANRHMSSVDKAQAVMAYVDGIADPELKGQAGKVTTALIDGAEIPQLDLRWVRDFEATREKSNDLVQAGDFSQALKNQQEAIDKLDQHFAYEGIVPRYFNSYADRVIYNHMFALPDEKTVLIPDELFMAHYRIADVLFTMGKPKEAVKHLNKAVSYAPSYTMVHLRQAVGLALIEDWDSAFAATLNAVNIAQDSSDAAFGYYRMAYAAWMRDEFDVAAAAYIMSSDISRSRSFNLQVELDELMDRARSQDLILPHNEQEARKVLEEHDIPIWPNPQVQQIVNQAARICVNNRLFVPAKTLLISSARMASAEEYSMKARRIQVLRSLNA